MIRSPETFALSTPLLQPKEFVRLARLRELVVLDTAPEPVFDDIARMASEICGAPIALISLIDAERQWFKANVGLPGVNETPRDVAFCAHAIASEDEHFEVPDATLDQRFAGNPLVTGRPDIRFYAGVPLTLAGGARVGTLCVIDREPRRLDESQLRLLRSLAGVATNALLMRQALINKSLAVRSGYERAVAESESRHRALVDDQIEFVSLAGRDGELVYVNRAYARLFGRTPAEMTGTNLFDFVEPGDRGAVRELIGQVLLSGESRSSQNRMVANDGVEHWVDWTNSVQRDGQGRVMLHSVGRDVTEHRRAEHRLAASERFLRKITDSLPLRISYVDKDRRYRFVNLAHCRRFGLERTQILGRTRAELASPGTASVVEPTLTAALAGTAQRLEFEELLHGRLHRFDAQLIPDISENGKIRGVFTTAMDITERSAAERTLRELTATLRTVAEAIPAIVSVVGPDERYRFVNSAFERWSGMQRDDIVGRSVAEVLGDAEYERTRPWMDRAVRGETVSFESEYDARRPIRHLAISCIPTRLESGELDGFVGVAQDITKHKREEGRLLRLSHRDPLTGLLNRSGFEAYLDRDLQQTGGESLALLYIDLDRFKAVNDTHGHSAGDELLRLFAKRVQELVRPTDAVARLGGDEFAVALAGVREKANADAVADKIVASAARPFAVGGQMLTIGTSVGVAFRAGDGGWQSLVEEADAQLYKAKAGGRGRRS
jgi:diguanylate cyclase (GGDEF)-like protein/PAS domain S-box-containing protein